MKRKTFLKRFAGALGALVAAPMALEALEPELNSYVTEEEAAAYWRESVEAALDNRDTVKPMLVSSEPPPPPLLHWNCRCVISGGGSDTVSP